MLRNQQWWTLITQNFPVVRLGWCRTYDLFYVVKRRPFNLGREPQLTIFDLRFTLRITTVVLSSSFQNRSLHFGHVRSTLFLFLYLVLKIIISLSIYKVSYIIIITQISQNFQKCFTLPLYHSNQHPS